MDKVLTEIENGSIVWWFDGFWSVRSFNNHKVIPILKRILSSIKNENSPLQIRVTKNQIEIYRERDGSIVKKMPNDVKEKI